jgi:hypothetical protein
MNPLRVDDGISARWLTVGLLGLLCWGLGAVTATPAQQLDMEILPKSGKPVAGRPMAAKPPVSSANAVSAPTIGKPLTATVSKTLYLPPAMYGEWSVTGTLVETNAQDFFNPVVNDIWILERVDDQVMISNPANGASAAISVDKVEGDSATFHRAGPAGRNRFFQEMPTIVVQGDTLTGRSVNKLQFIKDGATTREYYAVYQLQAERIGAARTRFKPEAEWQGPNIEIDDIRRQ